MLLVGDVVELIENLVLSLKASENWKEATFWHSQVFMINRLPSFLEVDQ